MGLQDQERAFWGKRGSRRARRATAEVEGMLQEGQVADPAGVW